MQIHTSELLTHEVECVYPRRYLDEVIQIAAAISPAQIERMVDLLGSVRASAGRVFFLGVGGSAANASHAVNDFRKIAGMECYAPTDNVSELTARINDDGWESSFVNWLLGSRLCERDAVVVFSVGGGSLEKNISVNLVRSLQAARHIGAAILGIVGRDGGYTAQIADECVVIPQLSPDTITAHAESFQTIVWHMIVSHPRMRRNEMKWESTR